MSQRLDIGTLAVCAVFLGAGTYAFVGAAAFTELGAIFPRVVAAAVVVLSLVAGGLSLLGSRDGSATATTRLPARPLLVAGSMAVWIACLPVLGFLVSGTLAFVAIAALIPGEARLAPRTLLRTTVVGAAICTVFYVGLRYGLDVPLPRGLLGML